MRWMVGLGLVAIVLAAALAGAGGRAACAEGVCPYPNPYVIEDASECPFVHREVAALGRMYCCPWMKRVYHCCPEWEKYFYHCGDGDWQVMAQDTPTFAICMERRPFRVTLFPMVVK